ncbi:MAG TPA: UDP-N-acetylmuramoyl-L-alanine--D-glutamate ligase [Rhodospirillales bacterium]|nr:UDP-N-acetylmuramoyl-L-alanine--D-glutamate ligase [Rhodospirillales bacterium]
MIHIPPFTENPVGVLGLGRSGLAAARALQQSGFPTWAWDDNAGTREKTEGLGLQLVDPMTRDWTRAGALVLSPGIPHTHPTPHPAVARAKAAGCPVIGDVDLLARSRPEATFIGITGTNGKSTTTALIGHILQKAGRTIQVGGNLGAPVLEMEPLGRDGIYVLELSSYQLELAPNARFDVALLLNVSPDHLERHGGMAGYLAAKKRIFANQKGPSTAIVGIDDERSRAVYEELNGHGKTRAVPVSGSGRAEGGIYAIDGVLYDETGGTRKRVMDLTGVSSLPGVHNRQNVAAAYAATRVMGIPVDVIATGIESYPGLAHRQELIAVIDGVAYVNDSKATNPDACARALDSYDDIYWIVGGLPKEGGLDVLGPYLGRVRHAFLIGEAEDLISRAISGKASFSRSETLDVAVAHARHYARAGGAENPVVLLSPACASFDQFENFEVRGEAFRALVQDLPGRRSR